MSASQVVVVMGVSGTGKSTVGRLLAAELGVPYAEADAFHPEANIAKMSAGTPLDDADRAPWLDAIGAWARDRQAEAPAARAPGGKAPAGTALTGDGHGPGGPGEEGHGLPGAADGPGLPVGVVSCSALRRRYRDRLRAAAPGLFFLHLTGDRDLIADRLARRRDHFMPGALLDSQYATLEPLEADEHGAALVVDAEPRQLVARAAVRFRSRPHPDAGALPGAS